MIGFDGVTNLYPGKQCAKAGQVVHNVLGVKKHEIQRVVNLEVHTFIVIVLVLVFFSPHSLLLLLMLILSKLVAIGLKWVYGLA
jgi:hypothetical protein